jgi:hypothetical protein
MAGELWRQSWGIGLESAKGTAVAPTRRIYVAEGDKLTHGRDVRLHSFSSGIRQRALTQTLGPSQPGGSITMPASATELVEPLLMGVKAAVTPTGATATKTWVFDPGVDLASASIHWSDGVNRWQMAGSRITKWKISGSVGGANTFSADLMGLSYAASASPEIATAQRQPLVHEGWETAVWISTFDTAPGGGSECGALVSWEIEYDNGLEREYAACNTLAAVDTTMDGVAVSGKFTLRAAHAFGLANYTNWNAGTPRHLRLEFGNNKIITGVDKHLVRLDIPCFLSAVDLGGSEAKGRTYEFSFNGVYAPTLAYMLRATLINDRATAW